MKCLLKYQWVKLLRAHLPQSCKEHSWCKAHSLLYDIWSELSDSYEVP